MAFGITVHRRADAALYQSHPDVRSEEFDRWCKECQTRWVYENPLGADGTVFEFWHVPAIYIGLPLLGSLYENGLRVEGQRLIELGHELDSLERAWVSTDFSQADPLSAHTIHSNGIEEVKLVPLVEHLHERLGYLREAIRIAVECDGVIDIS